MARFDSLKYAVHKVKPGEFVDKAIPELFKIPEFKALRSSKKHAADFSRVTKYVIYLYDKDSDLIHEFSNNLQARKDAAAVEAGFERHNGKWPKHVQDIMDVKDKEVNSAIMAFLRDQKHYVWAEICVTSQELDEFQALRFSSVSKKGKNNSDSDIIDAANKKEKLKAACESRIKSLETLYKQFFEDNRELQTAEWEEMISPEKAERIMKKTEAPYEVVKDESVLQA